MNQSYSNSNMSKKVHYSQRLLDKLQTWQRKIRTLTTFVPQKNLPMLTPAEPHGPDLQKFRSQYNALISWYDKQTQWWYFTGHLSTSSNRSFGFQLVFFERQTHKDYLGIIPARWLIPKAYAAHFAITDPMNAQPQKSFRYWQRGGLFSLHKGFAADDRIHVEVGGWYLKPQSDDQISLFANGSGNSLHLTCKSEKPLCYHGQSGFSQKSNISNTSSYYCSYTRMQATGQLLLDGRLLDVSGSAWMDHEKFTLENDLLADGWDWVSLQFDHGEELMFFITRHGDSPESSNESSNEDSNTPQFKSGSWINKEGIVTHLLDSDVHLENFEYWTSPRTKARYPLKRKVTIPSLKLEIELRPMVHDQEIDASRTTFITYWEGAITAHGTLNDSKVAAKGYMELVGYDQRPSSKLLKFLTTP